MRHPVIRAAIVRKTVDDGDMRIEKVPGDLQIADLLTKPLYRGKFEKLRVYLLE